MTEKLFLYVSTDGTGRARAFAEVVKLTSCESDIAAMTLQDALCLVILTWCKDSQIRKKMSELEEPTVDAFNTLIDGHMHNKAKSSASSANTQPNRGRGGNGRSRTLRRKGGRL